MYHNKLRLSLVAVLGLTVTVVMAEEKETGQPARTGKEIAQTCAACHGEKGISSTDMYPHLAGQHKSYLVQALKDYKNGRRENQIMNQMVQNLSDAEIRAVAEYYAEMPGLVTP